MNSRSRSNDNEANDCEPETVVAKLSVFNQQFTELFSEALTWFHDRALMIMKRMIANQRQLSQNYQFSISNLLNCFQKHSHDFTTAL